MTFDFETALLPSRPRFQCSFGMVGFSTLSCLKKSHTVTHLHILVRLLEEWYRELP